MKTLSEEVCSVCGSSALPGDHLCPVHMKELCKKFEDALKKQEQDEADRALGAAVRAMPKGNQLYHCATEDEELWGGSTRRADGSWFDWDVFPTPEEALKKAGLMK